MYANAFEIAFYSGLHACSFTYMHVYKHTHANTHQKSDAKLKTPSGWNSSGAMYCHSQRTRYVWSASVSPGKLGHGLEASIGDRRMHCRDHVQICAQLCRKLIDRGARIISMPCVARRLSIGSCTDCGMQAMALDQTGRRHALLGVCM